MAIYANFSKPVQSLIFLSTQNPYILIYLLPVHEHRQIVFGKHFVGYLEQGVGGKGFDAAEDGFGCFVAVVVQEGFAHAQGVVFVVVGSDANLTDELLFGGGQLRGSHAVVAQAAQFLVHQAGAEVGIGGIAAEVDAEGARVGVGSQVGLYVVDQSATLAQGHIEAAVHAGASQQVVEQVEGGAAVVVGVVAAAAYHDVCLVGVFVQHLVLGHVKRGRRTEAVSRRCRNVSQQLFGPTHHLGKGQIALHEKHHVARTVITGGKGGGIGTAKGFELDRIAKDVAAERMPAENKVFEVVEDKLGGVVFVRLDFVDNHLGFLLDFTLGESGVEHDIGQQLERTPEVFGQESRIDDGLFLVGVGIEVTAHILHAVQYVPCLALARTLENEVFYEMSHALFVLQFVARTGIDGKATIGHFRGRRLVDNAQAVGQRVLIVN